MHCLIIEMLFLSKQTWTWIVSLMVKVIRPVYQPETFNFCILRKSSYQLSRALRNAEQVLPVTLRLRSKHSLKLLTLDFVMTDSVMTKSSSIHHLIRRSMAVLSYESICAEQQRQGSGGGNGKNWKYGKCKGLILYMWDGGRAAGGSRM